MRILAFSDLHRAHARAAALVAASQEPDLVIGAGDFCNNHADVPGAVALVSELAAPMIAVPGNTESVGELRQGALPDTIVPHGSGCRAGMLKIFGLGQAVSPIPRDPASSALIDDAATEALSACDQADIPIVHVPPKGLADVASDGVSYGSTAIPDAIARIQSRLTVCGHIHEPWGSEGDIGRTRVVNLGPAPNWFEL